VSPKLLYAFSDVSTQGRLLRILIIDVEYLVALEAEQVLTDATGCSVEIVMPRDAPDVLATRTFDVILADASLAAGAAGAGLRRHHEAGGPIIFSSVNRGHLAGVPGFAGAAVISKPFDDELLVTLVCNVAKKKKKEG
jgi:DNA-binding response OmpR family regulator